MTHGVIAITFHHLQGLFNHFCICGNTTVACATLVNIVIACADHRIIEITFCDLQIIVIAFTYCGNNMLAFAPLVIIVMACTTHGIVTIAFHDLQDHHNCFYISRKQSLIVLLSSAYQIKLAVFGGRNRRSQVLEDVSDSGHEKKIKIISLGYGLSDLWSK